MATTLADIFQGVSGAVGGLVEGTTDANGDTTTNLKCGTLEDYPDDKFNEHYVLILDGAADGDERLIEDFANSSGVVTPYRDFSAQVVSGVDFEIHSPFPPSDIKAACNSAIKGTNYLFRVIRDTTRSTRKNVNSYSIPSTIIKEPLQIWIETFPLGTQFIHECEEAWDESVDTDVTCTLDSIDFQQNNGSVKMVVGAGISDGDILATDSISAIDLSDDIGVRFSIKSSVATAAADLQLLLDEDASCASPSETLDVPALVADEWQVVQVPYAGSTSDRDAIASVGLKYTANSGAATIHIDGIRSIKTNPGGSLTDMECYEPLYNWEYDGTNTKVRFHYDLPEDRRLLMIGKGYLTALTTEASSTEADAPDIEHLYSLTLAELYQKKMVKASYEERSEYERDVAYWMADAEAKGRNLRLRLPQKTRKIPGWTYYGKGTG